MTFTEKMALWQFEIQNSESNMADLIHKNSNLV